MLLLHPPLVKEPGRRAPLLSAVVIRRRRAPLARTVQTLVATDEVVMIMLTTSGASRPILAV